MAEHVVDVLLEDALKIPFIKSPRDPGQFEWAHLDGVLDEGEEPGDAVAVLAALPKGAHLAGEDAEDLVDPEAVVRLPVGDRLGDRKGQRAEQPRNVPQVKEGRPVALPEISWLTGSWTRASGNRSWRRSSAVARPMLGTRSWYSSLKALQGIPRE